MMHLPFPVWLRVIDPRFGKNESQGTGQHFCPVTIAIIVPLRKPPKNAFF
jgi:hypothetical protein